MGTITETVKSAAKNVARYQVATADTKPGAAAAAYTLGRLGGSGGSQQETGLVGSIAGAVGKGLLAGLVGTAAMTISSTIEMKLRDRGGSSAPKDAAAEVLGIEDFEDDDAERRFGSLAHWGYGTGWGAVRGLYGATGMPSSAATAAHWATVLGAEQVVLPALDVSPPVTEWGAKEIAVDAWHHAVYAVATGLVYERLDGRAA